MLKKLAALVVCSAAAAFSMSAGAAVVTGQTTMHTNVGLAGGYTDVNYYNFSTGGGNFSIDVFAVGYGTNKTHFGDTSGLSAKITLLSSPPAAR